MEFDIYTVKQWLSKLEVGPPVKGHKIHLKGHETISGVGLTNSYSYFWLFIRLFCEILDYLTSLGPKWLFKLKHLRIYFCLVELRAIYRHLNMIREPNYTLLHVQEITTAGTFNSALYMYFYWCIMCLFRLYKILIYNYTCQINIEQQMLTISSVKYCGVQVERKWKVTGYKYFLTVWYSYCLSIALVASSVEVALCNQIKFLSFLVSGGY